MKNLLALWFTYAFPFVLLITAVATFAQSPHLYAESDYPFKRVFTTEEERKILDKMRLQPQTSEQVSQINATAKAPSAPAITFSGVHIGTNGKHLVWVNGKSKLSKTPPDDDLKTSRPTKRSGSARIYNGAKSTRLKPGQVWLINSNEVQEGYEISAPEVSTEATTQAPKAEVPEALKTIKALKELNAQ